jgi:hypothetical protein
MTDRIHPTLVLALVLLSALAAPAPAADPAITCLTSKMLRAGAYDLCLLKATARAVKRGEPPDLAKCDAKFALAWAKIEAKAGGACPTTGDATGIAAQVQADVAAIVAALTPASSTTTTTSTTLPPSVPCGGAEFPGCGGSCPAGSSCWANVSPGPTPECVCRPAVATPCADTAGPVIGGACGGACPPGEVCSTLFIEEAGFNATCGCIPAGTTACLSFDAPVCGGTCPSGLTCASGSPLFACACE